MKNKLFFWIALLLISVGTIAAHDGDEMLMGKEIVKDKIPCEQLSDEELESVGEYVMETMHPGEAHELMHKMMGNEEGTAAHNEFHKAIAEKQYCKKGFGGMMMGGTTMGGMMSGGYGSMMGGYGLFGVLTWLLMIGLVIVVFLLIIKLWKDLGRKR